MTIVNVEVGAAGGWRWLTFSDGSATSASLREIGIRLNRGDWTITEQGRAAAQRVATEMRAA